MMIKGRETPTNFHSVFSVCLKTLSWGSKHFFFLLMLNGYLKKCGESISVELNFDKSQSLFGRFEIGSSSHTIPSSNQTSVSHSANFSEKVPLLFSEKYLQGSGQQLQKEILYTPKKTWQFRSVPLRNLRVGFLYLVFTKERNASFITERPENKIKYNL